MWTEILAVIIILLANLICYAAHEKSLFHGHLRLPKVLLVSNRASTGQQRSRSYLAFDILDPEHLVTSYWLSETGLLALRGIQLLFFAVTLTLEGTTGDGFGSRPATWWTYFTNWTFVLFAIWSALGIYVTAAHVQARLAKVNGAQPEQPPVDGAPDRAVEGSNATRGLLRSASRGGSLGSPTGQWTLLLKAYCLIGETLATSTLFLSAFFWSFLSGPGAFAIDNVLKHGVNNFFILADVLLSRQPLVSYHYQVTLIYGTVYIVFMFIYYGASSEWVYYVLDWDKPSALGLYVFLPLALFVAFLIWYWIALAREALGRRAPMPRQCGVFFGNSAASSRAAAFSGAGQSSARLAPEWDPPADTQRVTGGGAPSIAAPYAPLS